VKGLSLAGQHTRLSAQHLLTNLLPFETILSLSQPHRGETRMPLCMNWEVLMVCEASVCDGVLSWKGTIKKVMD